MLLVQLDDIPHGIEYAAKVEEAPVWSEVGHAQLAKAQVVEAIDAYLKASDCSKWAQVRGGAAAYGGRGTSDSSLYAVLQQICLRVCNDCCMVPAARPPSPCSFVPRMWLINSVLPCAWPCR